MVAEQERKAKEFERLFDLVSLCCQRLTDHGCQLGSTHMWLGAGRGPAVAPGRPTCLRLSAGAVLQISKGLYCMPARQATEYDS